MDSESQEMVILEQSDITDSMEKVIIKKHLRTYLTKEEINNRLRNIKEHKNMNRNKVLFITLWMTGMRESEIIYIKKGDIDFRNNKMCIRWLKSRKYYERVIPIHPQLSNILSLFTATMRKDERIFNITRQCVHSICRKYMHCNPHMFRHSFAINFLEQNKSPKAILILKDLLGHKHINTTMEYLKIHPSDLAAYLNEITFT